MANIHVVKCDRDSETMHFATSVKEAVQSYRCPKCQRRAILYLNDQGGVMGKPEYTDSKFIMSGYAIAGALGDLLSKK